MSPLLRKPLTQASPMPDPVEMSESESVHTRIELNYTSTRDNHNTLWCSGFCFILAWYFCCGKSDPKIPICFSQCISYVILRATELLTPHPDPVKGIHRPKAIDRVHLWASVVLLAGGVVGYWATRHSDREQLIRRRRKAIAANIQNENRLQMLAGKDYRVDKNLGEMGQCARALCQEFNQEENPEARQELMKELLGHYSEEGQPDNGGFCVTAPFHCDYGVNITLGKNFYCNFGCIFLDCAEIRIGDNVMLGPNVQIYTLGHPIDASTRGPGLNSPSRL